MSSEFRSADLAGVHVALLTPLKDDCPKRLRNSIDLEKAGRMIDDLIEAGVQGLAPIGTTGQSPTVTPKQHLEFVRFVIERVAGRVKVIAGAGSNCTRESVDMIGEIQKIAPGTPCLCLTGYYNNPPQAGIRAHFETIVAETDAPVVLYNIPSRTANYMEPETIIALAANPRIIGIKQGVNFRDPGKHRDDTIEIVRQTADLDFAVLSGEDGYVADLLEIGGKGVISAAGNIPEAARLFLEIHRAHLAGNSAGARDAQERLAPFVRWVFARKSPIPLSTLFASPVFLPLVDMAATENGASDVEAMRQWARLDAPSLARWWSE
ncbi:MAG: 4-hydroxy-tetrahydrodipicolinate synthase [Fibrobacterota bacterium]|nr:4-hydroxy-tetrahydrodipicolinate synthase [Fibrobacterota bacterium]QQS04080.1 MAG: 4-hydroxy-tetrahydrodipicolinate synthase [Fibrobacterota bacterium]